MTRALHGTVRRVRDDEIRAWCACPLAGDDPDLDDHVAGEMDWIDAWHDGPENLFVFDTDDGLLGKYDIPTVTPRRICLWAPSVAAGRHERAAMVALCEHIRAEGERRGVEDIEVILEGWHDHVDLAGEALRTAGIPLREEKVVVRRALDETLPMPTVTDVEFRPVASLSGERLERLVRDVDGAIDEPVSRGPALGEHPLGLTMWREDEPVGLVWPSSAPGDDVFTLHHIGLTPEARGHGLGTDLLLRALAAARTTGAEVYIGSTAVNNAAMRKTFERLGCEVLGRRFIHGRRKRAVS